MKFKIWYGLGGGFGGAKQSMEPETLEFDTKEGAESYAYDMAVQEYEMYEGSNGVREVADIMEEDGIEDENEAYNIYFDERESWLDFVVEEVS